MGVCLRDLIYFLGLGIWEKTNYSFETAQLDWKSVNIVANYFYETMNVLIELRHFLQKTVHITS